MGSGAGGGMRSRAFWTGAKIFIFVGVLGMAGVLCAQEIGDMAAWDKVDAQFMKRAKAETGDKLSAEVYQKLGLSYFRQEMFDRAFLYFNAAVKADPRLYWSWYYLGLLNLQDAGTYFEKAIQANNRFAPAYYWLGRYYMRKENSAQAIRIFEDYLRVADTDPNEQERVLEVQGLLGTLRPAK
jgi:tetratricopeptide (TPR) repeat protein